jgi:hypothetical protein
MPFSLEPILKREGKNGWFLMCFSIWSLHNSNFAFDFVAVPQITGLSDATLH